MSENLEDLGQQEQHRQTKTSSATYTYTSSGQNEGLSEEAVRQSIANDKTSGGGTNSIEDILTAGSVDESEFEALVRDQAGSAMGLVTSPEGTMVTSPPLVTSPQQDEGDAGDKNQQVQFSFFFRQCCTSV